MQGDEEFAVAVAALYGRGGGAEEFDAGEAGLGEGADFLHNACVDGGVADDSGGFVRLGFLRFELGFDECDEVAAGGESRPGGGEGLGERDEGEVHDDERVVGAGEGVCGEGAGVDFFEVGHARVGAQFGVELPVADVNAVDVGGAVLEEAVGEAAGGGADVEGVKAGGVDVKVGEGVGEFFSAAADVARGCFDVQRGVWWEGGGGFGDEGVGAGPDFSGHDEGFGEGACGGFALEDEELVGADFGGGHGGWGWGYSIFWTCSRMRSSSFLPSMTRRVMGRWLALLPMVLSSRLISWQRKSSLRPISCASSRMARNWA